MFVSLLFAVIITLCLSNGLFFSFFQFNVANNMEDQQLEKVYVEMGIESDDFTQELLVPEAKISVKSSGELNCIDR